MGDNLSVSASPSQLPFQGSLGTGSVFQNGAGADELCDLGQQDAVFHGCGKRVVVIRLKLLHRHVVRAADLAQRLRDVLLMRVQLLRLRHAADERLDAHGLFSAGACVLAQLLERELENLQ